jgi:hypothetical protein
LRPSAGAALFDHFGVHVLHQQGDRAAALAALRAFGSALAEAGSRVLHPLGDDAIVPVARTIGARIVRLRERAPFGALAWRDVIVSEGGRRAEAIFDGPSGERATVWLSEQGGKPAGGYRVDAGEATPALVEGLRAIMTALKPRLSAATTA